MQQVFLIWKDVPQLIVQRVCFIPRSSTLLSMTPNGTEQHENKNENLERKLRYEVENRFIIFTIFSVK